MHAMGRDMQHTHDVCAACVRAKHDEAHAHALHVGYLQATCKALEHAQGVQ